MKRMEMNNDLLARKHNNLNMVDDAFPTQLLVTQQKRLGICFYNKDKKKKKKILIYKMQNGITFVSRNYSVPIPQINQCK